jgi:hypothetical protein
VVATEAVVQAEVPAAIIEVVADVVMHTEAAMAVLVGQVVQVVMEVLQTVAIHIHIQ